MEFSVGSQMKRSFRATALIPFMLLVSPAWAQELLHQMTEPSETYAIAGGELNRAEAIAVSQCKKVSPFFVSAVVIGEELNLWKGRIRYFRCSFVEGVENIRPQSVEQKMMQTRRFEKAISDLAKAIKEWSDDNSGQVIGSLTSSMRFHRDSSEPVESHLLFRFGNSTSVRNLRLRIELTQRSSHVTDVRVRTYVQNVQGENEYFSRKAYEVFFNALAQQLSIEAIELQPIQVQ